MTNSKITGPLSIANGGTGATTIDGARDSLGVGAKVESIALTDDWQQVAGVQLRLPQDNDAINAKSVTLDVLSVSGLTFLLSAHAESYITSGKEIVIFEQNGQYALPRPIPVLNGTYDVAQFSARGDSGSYCRYWLTSENTMTLINNTYYFLNFLLPQDV